ncbi:MAG: hypothetical protein JRF63_09625, partial [Deltaproteobacteria bacterium]|nr:hypothetical protein [Deltaproteobacteria bacterium]
MRIPSVARLGLVSLIVVLTAILLAPLPFALEPSTEIAADEAGRILAALRSGFQSGKPVELPAELSHLGDDQVPLVLTAWKSGTRDEVWQVEGEPLSRAVRSLSRELIAKRFELRDPTLRLELDLAVAEGWLPQDGLLFSLSFVEGHDGFSGEAEGRRIYIPPAELIRRRMYGSFKPLPGYDPKFRIGIDARRALKRVSLQNFSVTGERRVDARDLRRFRALTMVEGADLQPRRLLKGSVARPRITRARLEAAVVAGAQYLVRALGKDGIFRYHYDPLRDRDVRDSYNWPRHAGTAFSMAMVGRILERPEIVEAAGRALVRFEEQLAEGPDGSRCLFAGDKCYLGSSALGLLALSEYRIASGDDRFDRTARAVAEFLLSMQKDDGFFHHDWYPDDGVDQELMKLYASQQAVLALAIHARAVGNDPAREAAKRGMDYLAGPYWDHFLGNYFFGQEHWTCLAAEEVYQAFPEPGYARLCTGIGAHYDNIIHEPGDTPFEEDVGGMSITHLFTPHLGGTATGAEAMVSALRLAEATGEDSSELRQQLVETYGFLVKH